MPDIEKITAISLHTQACYTGALLSPRMLMVVLALPTSIPTAAEPEPPVWRDRRQYPRLVAVDGSLATSILANPSNSCLKHSTISGYMAPPPIRIIVFERSKSSSFQVFLSRGDITTSE